MGTKRQRPSPRSSPILYHFARLVHYCAKQSDRHCTGHISKPSVYEDQRNLRVRASRERCCQLSSVNYPARAETFVHLLNFPRSTLEQYYPSILNVLLNRLQNTKTEPFTLRFVRLYHFISAKVDKGLGADFFISKLDQVQEGCALIERSLLTYYRSALT